MAVTEFPQTTQSCIFFFLPSNPADPHLSSSDRFLSGITVALYASQFQFS